MTQFNFFDLSDSQVKFLTNYLPKDDFFTSVDEINTIENGLGLIVLNDVEIIRSIRNSVVALYDKLMDSEVKYEEGKDWPIRSKKFWDYNTAMQSVTAVIDNFMYHIDRKAV